MRKFAREVRLISTDGEQLGIVPVKEALRIAQEQGLDLVELLLPRNHLYVE